MPRGENNEKTDGIEKSSQGDILNMDTSTKFGGAYIPRAKLRMMAASITDRNSLQYQRMMWEELKKSINGTINKANVSNLAFVVKDLIKENLIRGRGLIVRCCIRAQNASQTFTHVYAALVAVINTKFPQIGELLLKRLINQFKKAFKRNDKEVCVSSTRFLAHLFNQNVVHEIIILEILTLLLNNPTDDSIEVTVALIKECGNKMTDVCPRGLNAIFDTLRSILHTGNIDRRVQYMIEVLFAIRKDGFKDFPTVVKELDIVEEEDQYTHTLTLDEEYDNEQMLDVFKFDPQYEETEEKYKLIRDEILGKSDDEEGECSSNRSSETESSENEEDEEENEEERECIYDNTETNLVSLRRTIYLTIQSSVHFEECAHKLLKMNLKPGQEAELCQMILDACAQQRTYEKFFGLLAHRFCMLKRVYVEQFEKIFGEQYEIVHRLETVKLRNIAKFFAHLFCTDAISWGILSCISLNEDDTTSSSRVFIKNLFLELAENCGMQNLNERLQNPELAQFFSGLFPRDNPRDTRFSINFFTSIGLGGLTEELREYLKNSSSEKEKVPRKKSRKH